MRRGSVALSGKRYLIQSQIGAGGMGVVYRAHDRLYGREVALKCLALHGQSGQAGRSGPPAVKAEAADDSVASEETAAVPQLRPVTQQAVHSAFARTLAAGTLTAVAEARLSPSTPRQAADRSAALLDEELRVALAQEFHTLSSLRHPHIISVLDYGMDRVSQPFFTMELLYQAQTIEKAAARLTQSERAELLLQVLQALTYLHRRGVLHHDLKPANILVVPGGRGPQAKLLDFGLAVLHSQLRGRDGEVAGTLGYIAPELLYGTPPSESNDLYAFGVVAYELLVGRAPFRGYRDVDVVMAVTAEMLDWSATGLPPALNAFLQQLLAREPEDRFLSAEAAAHELAIAAGVPQLTESEGVRESYLQAAEMVGREAEMASLRGALGDALAGHGSAWLIGGESGVGKSRLCDELRTQAQVRGAWVLRGQAASHGGAGASLFAEALRALSLEVELSSLEASVLKTLVPNLPALLDRDIADPPELTAQAARLRLLSVVESILFRSTQSIVLLLEDLHWAEPDSIDLLRRITEGAGERRLLVLATYRDDERAELPDELPRARVLKLPRLHAEAVASLGESMLGGSGRRPELVELLLRESEGNTFFILEVMRVLAEEAGGLSQITQRQLPHQVFAGGVQAALQRRLGRVPPAMQPLLQVAAVAGRQLDLKVLREAEPTADLEAWLRRCADVAVLELSEQTWRFSHEKLRERLLTDLVAEQRRLLHGRVATAITAAYPDSSDHTAALAHHYEQAGDASRAGQYAALAGELAVQRGALADGRLLLEQALELAEQSGAPSFARGRLCRLLASAHFGLGQMAECEVLLRKACELVGTPLPADVLHLAAAILRQAAQQGLHRLHPIFVRHAVTETEVSVAEDLSMLYELMGEYFLWKNKTLEGAYAILLSANVAEQHGSPSRKAVGLSIMGVLFSVTPLGFACRHYIAQSKRSAEEKPDPRIPILYHRALVTAYLFSGDLASSLPLAEQTLNLAREIGDLYAQMYLRVNQFAGLRLLGELSKARESAKELMTLAKATGNLHFQTWAYGIVGADLMRRGQFAEAQANLTAAAVLSKRGGYREGGLYFGGLLALCALRLHPDQPEKANQVLDSVLNETEGAMFGHNGAYEGYPACVEAGMALLQRSTTAAERQTAEKQLKRALRVMRWYATVFPNGRPGLYLLRGRYQWMQGKSKQAKRNLERSLREAERQGMAYEAALALGWHGRLTPGEPGRAELRKAREQLTALDAPWDAEQVDSWLAAHAD